MNSGWVQIMGPAERVAQFKAVETDQTEQALSCLSGCPARA
jgi:hypothetical protein